MDKNKTRKESTGKTRTVKESAKEGTISREEARSAVQQLKKKVASDSGRLADAIMKTEDDRSVKETRRRPGQKFKQGQWVFDHTDGFHGFVTLVEKGEDGKWTYRVTSPAAHAVQSQERTVPEENIGEHKPREFRYPD